MNNTLEVLHLNRGTKADRYEGIDGLKAYAIIGIALMHVLANGEYGIRCYIRPSRNNKILTYSHAGGNSY